MSNLAVRADAEGLPAANGELSPRERMQKLADAWTGASPEERERIILSTERPITQEKAMSANHAPTDAPPFYREHEHPLDAARVRLLETNGLMILYDAMRSADEALGGALNRSGGKDTTEWESWIEEESERISDIRCYLMEELERRPMSGDRLEDDRRISYIIDWEFHSCGSGTVETMKKLATLWERAEAARREGRNMNAPRTKTEIDKTYLVSEILDLWDREDPAGRARIINIIAEKINQASTEGREAQ